MGSLCPEVFDGVEDIHYPLSLHPLNGGAQGAEGTRSPYASTKETETEGVRSMSTKKWSQEHVNKETRMIISMLVDLQQAEISMQDCMCMIVLVSDESCGL